MKRERKERENNGSQIPRDGGPQGANPPATPGRITLHMCVFPSGLLFLWFLGDSPKYVYVVFSCFYCKSMKYRFFYSIF